MGTILKSTVKSIWVMRCHMFAVDDNTLGVGNMGRLTLFAMLLVYRIFCTF